MNEGHQWFGDYFRHSAGANEYLKSLSTTVKDHLMSKWLRTQQTWYKEDPKVRQKEVNVLANVATFEFEIRTC